VEIKVGDPDPTPELDGIDAYCFAPHRLEGRWRTVYCTWERNHVGDHVSADVKPRVVVAVWPTSTPPEGRVWAPRDRRPWVLGPTALGIGEDDWTDQMIREGAKTGVNRQCSIGWHEECSDPEGESCKCACHPHAEEEDVEYVEVPLPALKALAGYADAARSQRDQDHVCSDAEQQQSDTEFRELIDALGGPGLLDEED